MSTVPLHQETIHTEDTPRIDCGYGSYSPQIGKVYVSNGANYFLDALLEGRANIVLITDRGADICFLGSSNTTKSENYVRRDLHD